MSKLTFDANEIEPGLFIGALSATENNEELIKHNISCILSVGMIINNSIGLLDYDRFIIQDNNESDISQYFERGIAFIEKNLMRNENVLVHCYAGVSRSVTIVAAYLIKKYKINSENALSIINNKRKISPNKGFLKQLNIFSNKILQSNTIIQ